MAWAALIGSTVQYTDYYHCYTLETIDNRVISVSKSIFQQLYQKIDKFNAALKGDCIEYASNDPMIDLFDQPEWYIDACADLIIYENCGQTYMQDDYHGEVVMSPNSVVLRNFKGELRYMEWDEFLKYYDVPGSEFID